ncbi:MAG: hypothetical protein PHO32_07170 [Candidatus Cloacimonetes bacterium]|nr:hypothetical protein [Candidatus Cloacimonadota bacterium]
MKRKTSSKKQHLVSQIVQSVDCEGRNMLGFTVDFRDGSFYNVIRTYCTSEYTNVMAEMIEKREAILVNALSKKDFR